MLRTQNKILQPEFDFNVLVPQNCKEAEEILLLCEKRLSKNCKTLYEALLRGEKLTGVDIIVKYKITEYRRRIKDLKDSGIEIKDCIGSNGCKTWWIEV